LFVIVAAEVQSVPDVDLNCQENVSDSDEHSDDESIENKVFPQQRFSPVTSLVHPATLRPRPIKMRSVSATSTVRPAGGTPAFQPRGEVFKARAVSLNNSSGEFN